MRVAKCALLCAILALSFLEPIVAKRGFSRGGSHSYPKSGGLSGGGGHHSYPSSGGLSGGGGGSHGYPSSGGLSGGGSHPHPPTGSNHGYPSSNNNHGYPSSNNNHGYPSSGSGLSGNSPSNTHHSNNHGYPAGKGLNGQTTTVHHHYHYNPPQRISYAPTHGGPPVNYPVYRGTPPTYVYQYKDSGSKYGTLLAGLALLNLGTLAAGTAYAVSHSHSSSSSYKPTPGEVCKFGLKKDNGDYEETKIDCQLISSFILQSENEAKSQNGAHNTTVTTTTVTNVTMVNTTNAVPESAAVNQTGGNVLYQMLPNGTLVPVNVSATNVTVNTTSSASPSDNPVSSSVTVTTTTTNTTVVNALDVKGKEVQVTPGMKCYVLRVTSSSKMRKEVPCGLLQTYAEKSLKRNSAVRNAPAFTILVVALAAFVMY